jgi:hypothetical protein
MPRCVMRGIVSATNSAATPKRKSTGEAIDLSRKCQSRAKRPASTNSEQSFTLT